MVSRSPFEGLSIRQSQRQETKSRVLSYDAVDINDVAAAPIQTGISAVAQGISQNQRIGNSIRLTGFYSKFVVASADSSNIIRFILYFPRNPADTLAGTDIHTLIDQDKFNVIYDRYHVVGTSGGPGVKGFTIARNFHRGVRKGIEVKFHGVNNTDYASAPLRMYIVSDSAAVPHPKLSGNLRLYFKDA